MLATIVVASIGIMSTSCTSGPNAWSQQSLPPSMRNKPVARTVDERSEYIKSLERNGYRQKDDRFTVTTEDTQFGVYVTFEGIGYEFKDGFNTTTSTAHALHLYIGSTVIENANPELSSFRVTDADGNKLFDSKGSYSRIRYNDNTRGYYASNTLTINREELAFPLTVETLDASKRMNTYTVSRK